MDEWEEEPVEYTSEEAAYDAWIEQLEDSTPADLLELVKKITNKIEGLKQEYEIKTDKLKQQNRIILEVLKEKLEDKGE